MATSIDLILAPREVKTVTLSEAGVIQNKNIPSGLKVGNVIILMNEYADVDAGSITIENLGWTHAFLSNTGTVPPAIAAEAVYLSSAGLAIVGTSNPTLSYTTNPEASDGYTTSWQVITDEGATPSVSIGEDGKWSVLTEDEGSSIQVTLTNQDGTVVTDSSGIHPSTLGVVTDSTDAIDVGSTYQLVWTISPSELQNNDEVVLDFTTTDTSVVTIDSKGLATGIGDGFARIGVMVKFRGATASDSSGIIVNAVAPKPKTYDFTTSSFPSGVSVQSSSGRLYWNGTNTTLSTSGNGVAPAETNSTTGATSLGRSIPVGTYNQLVTDTGFTSLGASGSATPTTWITGNMSALTQTTTGVDGGAAMTAPTSFSLMGIYNVQASSWVKGPGTPDVITQITPTIKRRSMTATIPNGCTSVRFYVARADTVNYVYAVIPVTAGNTYTFSVYAEDRDGVTIFSVPNITQSTVTRPATRATSYGGVSYTVSDTGTAYTKAQVTYSNGVVINYSGTYGDFSVPTAINNDVALSSDISVLQSITLSV